MTTDAAGGGGAGGGGNGSGGSSGSGGAVGATGGSGTGGRASGTGGVGSGGRSGGTGGRSNAGGAGGGSVAFTAVQAIFDRYCTDCHLAGAIGLPGGAPMALTADASYAALVGKAAAETCGGTRVVPGDSGSSYLVHKLTDTPPCSGERMPRALEGGGAGVPLDAGSVATIRRWIDEGARR
jgi:hypothetical protein